MIFFSFHKRKSWQQKEAFFARLSVNLLLTLINTTRNKSIISIFTGSIRYKKKTSLLSSTLFLPISVYTRSNIFYVRRGKIERKVCVDPSGQIQRGLNEITTTNNSLSEYWSSKTFHLWFSFRLFLLVIWLNEKNEEKIEQNKIEFLVQGEIDGTKNRREENRF